MSHTLGQQRVALIILAAGLARRMGESQKLHASLGDKAVLNYSLSAAKNSAAAPIFLVSNDTLPEDADSAIERVPEPNAHRGQSHSLAAGVAAAAKVAGISGAIVLLGDMPFIRSEHINRVIAEAQQSPNMIIRPCYKGKPGHPVYWPKSYFKALMALQGDTGAKPVLNAAREAIRALDMDDDAVVFDIDTPAQLDAARTRIIPPR